MVSVTDLVHTRSLGSFWKRSHLTAKVPQVDIQSFVDANSDSVSIDIRDHVILGFVPDYPDTLLVLRNPLRVNDSSLTSYTSTMSITTTSFWTINFHTLKIIANQSSWAMPTEEFQTLTSCSSAFSSTTHRMLQVTCFCPDQEHDSGIIRLKSTRTSPPVLSNDWLDTEANCSSTEIVSAVTCFAHCTEYVTVLLRTRCVFFVLHCQGNVESRDLFWTTDYDVDSARHCIVRIFEFDIFVEQLLTKQQTPFGHHQPARWTYLAMLDTRDRNESLRQAQIICEQRHHQVNLENGSIFFVGVLGDDLRSILLLTVLVDPTPIKARYRDHVVLDGKRWTLAKQATENPLKVLARVIDQIHNLPKHDCGTTCHRPDSKTKVLATYEPHGTKSLELIEGEYWTITGTAWSNG